MAVISPMKHRLFMDVKDSVKEGENEGKEEHFVGADRDVDGTGEIDGARRG